MKYRYYNPQSGTWSERLYSLEELSRDSFFDDDTMLATEDGQRTLTYRQAFQDSMGRGKYANHPSVASAARYDKNQKYTNRPAVASVAKSVKDQKYTNCWIRAICKLAWFLTIFSLSSSTCVSVSLLFLKFQREYGVLLGVLLGLVIAMYSEYRIDMAARSASEE